MEGFERAAEAARRSGDKGTHNEVSMVHLEWGVCNGILCVQVCGCKY